MLNGAQQYFDRIIAIQQRVIDTQRAALSAAADILVVTLKAGGRIFIFGSGHSHMLAEEAHYRAGGLAAVVPILSSALMLHESAMLSTALERLPGIARPLLAQYQPESRDCLFVISNSGVNAAPVEIAQAAREHGMKVIAIVSLAYAAQAPVSAPGVKLPEIADVVIDNCGPPGDAIVPLRTPEQTIHAGPSSTVVGAFILNALFVEAASRLAEATAALPPVYISANTPGAAAHNQKLLDQYRSKNPHL